MATRTLAVAALLALSAVVVSAQTGWSQGNFNAAQTRHSTSAGPLRAPATPGCSGEVDGAGSVLQTLVGADGWLYVVHTIEQDIALAAFEPVNCDAKWSAALNGNSLGAAVSDSGAFVIYAAADGAMVGVDPHSGDVQWTFRAPRYALNGELLLDAGLAYGVEQDTNQLYGVDQRDGRVFVNVTTPLSPSFPLQLNAVLPGTDVSTPTFFFTQLNASGVVAMYAVSLQGARLYALPPAQSVVADADADVLYAFGAYGNTLMCYGASQGALQWTRVFPGDGAGITGVALVDGGNAMVSVTAPPSGDAPWVNRVYAVSTTNQLLWTFQDSTVPSGSARRAPLPQLPSKAAAAAADGAVGDVVFGSSALFTDANDVVYFGFATAPNTAGAAVTVVALNSTAPASAASTPLWRASYLPPVGSNFFFAEYFTMALGSAQQFVFTTAAQTEHSFFVLKP